MSFTDRENNKGLQVIETLFEIENISWEFQGVDKKTGVTKTFQTASGNREREYKKQLADTYTFI